MSDTLSERAVLADIATKAATINRLMRRFEDVNEAGPLSRIDRSPLEIIERTAHEIRNLARELAMQVAEGVHTNPPLVIYGNPPMRTKRAPRGVGGFAEVEMVETMSEDVHEIRYTHVQDGKDYVHKFDPGAMMTAGMIARRKVVVIGRLDNKPVWKDFR